MGGKVGAETHSAGDGLDDRVSVDLPDGGHGVSAQQSDGRGRVLAQRNSGLPTAFGDARRVGADLLDGPLVVGDRRWHVDDGCGSGQVGGNGGQRSTGVADQRAQIPLAQPRTVPRRRRDRFDEFGEESGGGFEGGDRIR